MFKIASMGVLAMCAFNACASERPAVVTVEWPTQYGTVIDVEPPQRLDFVLLPREGRDTNALIAEFVLWCDESGGVLNPMTTREFRCSGVDY